jgi:hypothetical protein
MKAKVWWQWDRLEISGSARDDRVAHKKAWTREEFPSQATQELSEDYLTGLVKRQLLL